LTPYQERSIWEDEKASTLKLDGALGNFKPLSQAKLINKNKEMWGMIKNLFSISIESRTINANHQHIYATKDQ